MLALLSSSLKWQEFVLLFQVRFKGNVLLSADETNKDTEMKKQIEEIEETKESAEVRQKAFKSECKN